MNLDDFGQVFGEICTLLTYLISAACGIYVGVAEAQISAGGRGVRRGGGAAQGTGIRDRDQGTAAGRVGA